MTYSAGDAQRSCTVALLDVDPAWALRAGGKLNVPVYRLTRGRVGGKVGRAPVLLLTTTGRRSGPAAHRPGALHARTARNVIVIGSNAGNENEPGWSLQPQGQPRRPRRDRRQHGDVRARVAGARSASGCGRR